MSEILSILKREITSPTSVTGDVGRRGEILAAEFLEANGYRLVVANFKVPIGRNRRDAAITGEIDIIALDGDVLCFIEVKTRSSDDFLTPLAAVKSRKQRQITRAARIYRRMFGVREMPYRFDVVTVVAPQNPNPSIEIVKAFWTEGKFRKRVWSGDII